MSIISKVVPQKKNDKRISIFIDEKFVCGLSRDSWTEYGLKVGDEVSPELLKKLEAASEEGKFFDRILHFLSFRPRSEQEVVQKLLTITHQNQIIIRKIIEKLKKYQYIDDDSFSRWWVEQRKKQGKGKRVVYQELLQKGVSKQIIELVLEEEETAGESQALALLDKNSWRFKTLDYKDKKKMQDMLARRGFSFDEIHKAVSDFLTNKK